ncbi:MAG: CDP-glucose 4,6-dehydratase [bacterium]
MDKKFWQNKRVFITGHTGFKGSWLCMWLSLLGAKVTGYALKPPTKPSLFELCRVEKLIKSVIGDVRDIKKLKKVLQAARPELVIHMAAQPIVRDSYKVPVETYSTNVMGTVNLLEAARACSSVKAILNVTTDKVYENVNKKQGYKEIEALGGYDPYSSSKACSELISTAYRSSYLMNIATARAGNVIGGGDWAVDRLIPDFVRAVMNGKKIKLRYPKATRPWQHVLEPLRGYLLLTEKLYKQPTKYAQAWNFAPNKNDCRPVEWLVKRLCVVWGKGAGYSVNKGKHLHEASFLMLDSTKARKDLGWKPKWGLSKAIEKIVEWTRAYQKKADLRKICFEQIEEYMQ